jgi:hypothetical protein
MTGRPAAQEQGLPRAGRKQRADPPYLHVGRGLPARRQRRAERFICEYHRAPAWLGKLSRLLLGLLERGVACMVS